jgi:hypothetical protein
MSPRYCIIFYSGPKIDTPVAFVHIIPQALIISFQLRRDGHGSPVERPGTNSLRSTTGISALKCSSAPVT